MSFPASMFEPFLTSVYIVTHWGKHVLKIFTLKKFMKRKQATFAVLSTNLFSVQKRNVSSKTSYTKKIHVLILPLKLCRFQLDNWTALKKYCIFQLSQKVYVSVFPNGMHVGYLFGSWQYSSLRWLIHVHGSFGETISHFFFCLKYEQWNGARLASLYYSEYLAMLLKSLDPCHTQSIK